MTALCRFLKTQCSAFFDIIIPLKQYLNIEELIY